MTAALEDLCLHSARLHESAPRTGVSSSVLAPNIGLLHEPRSCMSQFGMAFALVHVGSAFARPVR